MTHSYCLENHISASSKQLRPLTSGLKQATHGNRNKLCVLFHPINNCGYRSMADLLFVQEDTICSALVTLRCTRSDPKYVSRFWTKVSSILVQTCDTYCGSEGVLFLYFILQNETKTTIVNVVLLLPPFRLSRSPHIFSFILTIN